MDDLPLLPFGRETISQGQLADSHEWLVCNGIGGYASSSIAGMPTRGYHGLLVAALQPPVDRRVLVPALGETLDMDGRKISLGSLRWGGGVKDPDASEALVSFRLDGGFPVWVYQCAGVMLERRLWMDHGANVTRIAYRLLRAPRPLALRIDVITDCRDYHGRSFASGWLPDLRASGDTLTAVYGDVAIHAALRGGTATTSGEWWRNFDLAAERRRGLTDHEDHVHAGRLELRLQVGEEAQLVLSTGQANASINETTELAERARQAALLKDAQVDGAPHWVKRLILAADQFIVLRNLHDGTPAHTVIAGYHWFADWGRDTMISLPGLTLVTKRPEIARSILRAFADVLDRGMIPNRFPDGGSEPEFNTVDATFWFVEAIAAVDRYERDERFLEAMFPVLENIVLNLKQGTRYGIVIDPDDGLVRAGEQGVQLTWMDARVGDWVVTPRIGKPVEVNALWISNLRFMLGAAERLDKDPAEIRALLDKAVEGFQRFWNPDKGFCFDVLDGPDGHEALLRPNQLLAARAVTGALSADQAKRVVEVCEEALWTPCGLRSLAPSEPGYLAHYEGDQSARDAAYHMGTVWPWLIGPFIEAHLDTHHDAARAMELLSPLADQLKIEGLGTIGEIFEAAPPHAPRGCIAQAWSVAEMLRAWSMTVQRSTSLDANSIERSGKVES
jgi:predicted glycogen debranching enzyme